MIESRYFKVSAGRYVKQALGVWIGRWWWAILLPLCALVVMGVHDGRYLIVALAVVLVVYPGVLMLVYYNHALRPHAALSVIPHKISIDSRQMTITYQHSDDYRVLHPRAIPLTDVTEAEDAGETLLIHLKGGRYDFIIIPIDAMRPEDITRVLELLHKT